MLGGTVVSFLVMTPGMLARSWDQVPSQEGLDARAIKQCQGNELSVEALAFGGLVLVITLGFALVATILCSHI
jgi:hypothetical protein